MHWRLLLAPLLGALLLAAPPAATQAPITQDACADATPGVTFAQWDTQLENLVFDGAGRMYVSDLGADRLLSVDATGAITVLRQMAGIHGMVMGPDGLLYVGAAVENGAGAGPWQVWRFHDETATTYDIYAEGLPTVNGMAFDAEGNLFVSNPLAQQPPYLMRIPRADPGAWTEWWTGYGPNGLFYDAASPSILAAITADQSSDIVRISVTDPTDVTTVARLSFGAATLAPGIHAPGGQLAAIPKGLDDLTLAADGNIYATGHVSGELLRVDPETGAACVLASGLFEPTSVRVAEGFGDYDGWLFVTDMGGVGVTALALPAAGSITAFPVN